MRNYVAFFSNLIKQLYFKFLAEREDIITITENQIEDSDDSMIETRLHENSHVETGRATLKWT